MKELYLGNYGMDLREIPHDDPPKLPEWAWEFVNRQLYNNISRLNTLTWTQQKLKILASMLENKELSFYMNEILLIDRKIGESIRSEK